jgi:hypothetical protein
MLAASAVLAVLLWGLQAALAGSFDSGTWARSGALALLVLGGIAGYGIAAQLAGAVDWRQLPRLLRRRPAGG